VPRRIGLVDSAAQASNESSRVRRLALRTADLSIGILRPGRDLPDPALLLAHGAQLLRRRSDHLPACKFLIAAANRWGSSGAAGKVTNKPGSQSMAHTVRLG